MVPPFLTSTLDGGGWSVLQPREAAPCTLWLGGWVGSTYGLDAMKERKVLLLLEKENCHASST
jgi:hypothetical protein